MVGQWPDSKIVQANSLREALVSDLEAIEVRARRPIAGDDFSELKLAHMGYLVLCVYHSLRNGRDVSSWSRHLASFAYSH
jgi:hypothetical protein